MIDLKVIAHSRSIALMSEEKCCSMKSAKNWLGTWMFAWPSGDKKRSVVLNHVSKVDGEISFCIF